MRAMVLSLPEGSARILSPTRISPEAISPVSPRKIEIRAGSPIARAGGRAFPPDRSRWGTVSRCSISAVPLYQGIAREGLRDVSSRPQGAEIGIAVMVGQSDALGRIRGSRARSARTRLDRSPRDPSC